jgi:hypothetical protein
MRFGSQDFPFHVRPGTITSLGFLCFALFAALVISRYISAGDWTALIYIAIGCIAAAIGVAILQNWRNGVFLFFAWLLFEDFARKFLGNNMAIYFGKDLLAILIFISFLGACRRKTARTFRPPFLVSLLVLASFGLIQILNTASPHLAFGLLGFKLYFFYVPLTFVGYSLLDSERDLRRFFLFSLGLAIFIAALGIAQAILGSTFLNPAVAPDELRELSTLYRQAPISGVEIYRPTSVFVSDGRFASYMIFSWIIGFGVSAYLLLRNRKGRFFVAIGLAVLTVGVVLTGSRGAILWTSGSAVILAAAFFWGAPWRQEWMVRMFRALQRALFFGGVAVLCLFVLNPEALLSRYAFYWETLSLDSPQSELLYRAHQYPLQNLLAAFDYPRWPYGYGIGTTSLGVQYVTRFFHVQRLPVGVENGYGALVLELGIVGLILWLIMSVAVTRSCWRVVRKLRLSPLYPLAFAIFWFVFLLLFPLTYNSMVQYQNFVLNAYMWLLVGILFRLPEISLSIQSPTRSSSSSLALDQTLQMARRTTS